MLLSAIAALSGAVVYLYRENRSLQKQWRDDIQAYAKELLELNKQTTSAVNGLEELYERISRGGARR